MSLKHLNVGSIPADVMTQITEWPVKSAFITKGHAEHAKRATSKMHRFKPSVSLQEALVWADSQESSYDVTLVFENDNSIRFEENTFKCLDVDS